MGGRNWLEDFGTNSCMAELVGPSGDEVGWVTTTDVWIDSTNNAIPDTGT